MEQRGIRLALRIEFDFAYGQRDLTAMVKRFGLNRPRRDYYREDEITRMTHDPKERLGLMQQMKDRGIESYESESEARRSRAHYRYLRPASRNESWSETSHTRRE
jgi:hypothetical protein